MRSAFLLLLVLAHGAAAQPALTAAVPSLTTDERETLARGEISGGAYAGGILASIGLGFGTGQAIQGRWSDTGYIFTLGEVGSLALLIAGVEKGGLGECYDACHRSKASAELAIGGLVTFMVLRYWEIGDAAIAPGVHNHRYHQLVERYGGSLALSPYVAPHGDGAVAGLAVTF
jgi:hypothetical protein